MNPSKQHKFLSGVVEGFYGKPWTFDQRHRLIGWLHDFGLNTYCHGPKDDLKHRVLWRDLLDKNEEREFGKLIDTCYAKNIRFIYAISPAWDSHFEEIEKAETAPDLVPDLTKRFEQLLRIGCTHFSIQFDDVPNLSVEQRHELALWHSDSSNRLWDWLRSGSPDAQLIMCPAVYCSAMSDGEISDCDYLRTLGENLSPDVQIYWTGPNIISENITSEHLLEISRVLKRPPFIWDNLLANDYDPARPHMGAYSNRTSDLTTFSNGVLLNPNCQFELNFVPLLTLGKFLESVTDYSEHSIVAVAAKTWQPEWERIAGEPFSIEIIQLVIDCFHTPFDSGNRAADLLHVARQTLKGDVRARSNLKTTADQLATLFHDLATLKNRDLLDALWSPIWKLKDELELIGQLAENSGDSPHLLPDFPDKIVRGGLIRELQRLTKQHGAAGYSIEK